MDSVGVRAPGEWAMHFLGATIVLAAACSGCSARDSATTDAWAGRWNGPEGTFMEITGSNGRYRITIRDLDAARTFDASASGNGVAFERDGVKEFILATGGRETGMKWLLEKQDCLTVKYGEGYCRD